MLSFQTWIEIKSASVNPKNSKEIESVWKSDNSVFRCFHQVFRRWGQKAKHMKLQSRFSATILGELEVWESENLSNRSGAYMVLKTVILTFWIQKELVKTWNNKMVCHPKIFVFCPKHCLKIDEFAGFQYCTFIPCVTNKFTKFGAYR